MSDFSDFSDWSALFFAFFSVLEIDFSEDGGIVLLETDYAAWGNGFCDPGAVAKYNGINLFSV